MQLQDVDLVVSRQSEALWCKTEAKHTDEAVLKLCAVKLVDIRKMQTLNLNISDQHLSTGGESSVFGGDQATLQTRLKMISVKLVDCRKAKAAFEQDNGAYGDFMPSDPSRFDGAQQTLHAQLKLGLVRLVDCKKVQNTGASEVIPPGRAHDHKFINNPSSRFSGEQETLHAQIKTSSVRLVDCGKIQSRNCAAVGEAEGGFKPSSDQEDEERPIKRRSTRNVRFGRHSDVPHGSESVFRYRKSFGSSPDLRTRQSVHAGAKQHDCTHCGKEFPQRSQLRRHQRVHTGEKLY